MNKAKRFLNFILLTALCSLQSFAKDYKYTSVPNDPMQSRIYTLDNGLKVYMTVNKATPRIQTFIAVRVGGKNDPAETTGLAHYFEHLMFKGSEEFGTSNYAKEKPLLDAIEQEFEIYRKTKDEAQRKAIYHIIDSLSYEASKISIPNEYDKLMGAIGADGTNAYTSFDVTCYMEDIPSNEIDNWAKIQSNRFKHAVIRGFHTELETVYEEKNMSLTNDNRKTYETLLKALFKHHPYGTQTVLGTQEHLKNPSITNIKNYYKNWYVANNIAICLSGDFDPDMMISTIDRYFGDMRSNPNLPVLKIQPEEEIKQPISSEVLGLDAEKITLGWRTPGTKSKEFDYLDIISQLMSNGNAGLIDQNLNQEQKVLGAGAGIYDLSDYSMFLMIGAPKQGQTLDEVKQLLLEQVDKLRKGDFDERLLTSILNNNRKDKMEELESNKSRADMFVQSFINGTEWKDEVERMNRLSRITKKDIISFANRYLKDTNYAMVYKRQGKDPNELKIEKPKITPIETNRNMTSDFLVQIQQAKTSPIAPVFLDFQKDMSHLKAQQNIPVLYKKNITNGLFELTYVFNIGSNHDNLLPMAANYNSYLGTSKKSANEIKSEFYNLACDYNIYVSNDRLHIALNGLSENMEKAIRLMEEVLSDAKADKTIYLNLVADELKARNDSKLNQNENFSRLNQYGLYGAKNPANTLPSEAELKALDPQKLIDKIKALSSYQHSILYYGPMSEKQFINLIRKDHKTASALKPTPTEEPFKQQLTPENKILVAQYDAKQIRMRMISNNGEKFIPEDEPVRQLFNEYFGGNMSSIVFQEMREARGLAYSAWVDYSRPEKLNESYLTKAFIASQNDKMIDAISAFQMILSEMPQSEASFNIAKEGMLTRLRTQRILKSDILWYYLNAKRVGLDYDIRKTIYEKLPTISLQDITEYQKRHIKNNKYTYSILGDTKDLDMNKLGQIAPIQKISQEELFGY